eukprot:11594397-Karenia_brevis.AAC.1
MQNRLSVNIDLLQQRVEILENKLSRYSLMLRLLSSRLETLEELQDPDDPRLISTQTGGLSNAQLWDHLMDLDQ